VDSTCGQLQMNGSCLITVTVDSPDCRDEPFTADLQIPTSIGGKSVALSYTNPCSDIG